MKFKLTFIPMILVALLIVVLSACGGGEKATEAASEGDGEKATEAASEDMTRMTPPPANGVSKNAEKKEILPGIEGWLERTVTRDFEYDSEGRVTSWTDSYGTKAIDEYNADGTLTERLYAGTEIMVYEEDPENSLNRIKFDYQIFDEEYPEDLYSKPGKRLVKKTEQGDPNNTTEYEYNADGLLSSRTRDGDDNSFHERFDYEYDDRGGIINVRSEVSGWEVGDSKDNSSYEYEYNEDETEVKITDDFSSSAIIIEYKYYDNGDLQEKKVHYDERYTVTRYDNDGNMALYADVEGKDTLSYAVEYEYNKHGDCIKEVNWVGEDSSLTSPELQQTP